MRILVISHGFPPHAAGGAEIYAHAHASALVRGGDRVLVITREADTGRPEYAVRHEERDGLVIAWINNTFAEVRSFEDTYRNDRIGSLVAHLADEFAPQVAHLHHLTCLSTTIVHDLATRAIPIFFTLHDYWLICHRGQLLDVDLQVCDGPEPDGCQRCLGTAAGASPGVYAVRGVVKKAQRLLPKGAGTAVTGFASRAASLTASDEVARVASAERLQHMRGVASGVTQFLAPSRFIRDRFVAFGIAPDRIALSEYGCEVPTHSRTETSSRNIPTGAPLRVGFLGSLMVSKAPHVLLEARAGLPAGSVTVDLIGDHVDYHGDVTYRRTLEPLLAITGVRVHGKVPHDSVQSLLAQMDVLVVPSIWPENSPLVIREAFTAGVPVVASRIGGIPETVTDEVNGLLCTPGDVADLRRALARLIDEPELLPRLRRGIPPVRSLADDVAFTRGLYVAAVAGRATDRPRLAAVVLNYGTPDDTLLATRSLLLSRRPIDEVIVVDNDVSGVCQTRLSTLIDRITYLPTGANLGFSGGMNAGVRAALAGGAERVLVVNSDVIVPADCVAALERAVEANPGVGIAGPIVMARHAPDRVVSMGMSYNRSTGRMRHRGVGARPSDHSGGHVTEIAGVSGCLMLITRDAWTRVGGFHEDFFYGLEDLDLCLRARDAGFRTVVAGTAEVLHEGGASIGANSPRRLYFAARNHLLLARRNSPDAGRVVAAFRTVCIIALNIAHAFRAPGASLWDRLGAVARGTRDYFVGRFGPDRT